MEKAIREGQFGNIHLRITGREDGIVRVTRDLDGSFREPVISTVCPCPAGKWTAETDDGQDVFAAGDLEIRVRQDTGAVSFFRKNGELLLRERPACPAELERADIILNTFRNGSTVTETMGVDGVRATAAPSETRRDRIGVRGKLYFDFQPEEGLYGLGSHEEGFGNLRGHARLLKDGRSCLTWGA